MAQNTALPDGSAIDGRITRHEGYSKSINARRGIEKVFGWNNGWGRLRLFKVRGPEKVGAVFSLHMLAYNLIRLGNLLNPAIAAACAVGCSEVRPGSREVGASTGQNA